MSFGGSGGGSGSISTSTDVALNNPANGQVLSYNGTLAKWVNSTNPSAPVTSVAGKTGVVTLAASDVGLGSVNNTSDAAKPLSTATVTALSAKANTSSLATVATSGSYGDLTGTAPFARAFYNSGTSTWPSRPNATSVEWIGGDEAHPPTAGVTGVDTWIREATV